MVIDVQTTMKSIRKCGEESQLFQRTLKIPKIKLPLNLYLIASVQLIFLLIRFDVCTHNYNFFRIRSM